MVGSRKLSNEEVEALLSGLNDEAKEQTTEQFDPNEVREFKFGTEDLSLLGDYYALRMINEKICRFTRSVFLPMLRIMPRISSFPPEVKSFDEYVESCDNFVSVTNSRIEELRGNALLVIEAPLVSHLTNTYYGGSKVHSLFAQQGEFTAIVGPSGSGKTTFFFFFCGLDTPTSGNVVINDTDITNLKSNELIDFRLRNIGFVFQAYNLIPVLTAKENVEFIMLMQGDSANDRKLMAEELLNAVGLSDQINRRPGQLSGGQQQRVAVARALASKPKFVLADEPTANLDSTSTSNLLDIMYKLNKEENMTFIFSTHDQRVIDRAKRIITLEDGKILSDKKQ